MFASYSFRIFLTLLSISVTIAYLPLLILKNRQSIADNGAKVWTTIIVWVLDKVYNIKYEVRGIENIPQDGCVIACKHQSMWETIIMHLIINRPAYAYKKELLKIPIYGWYVGIMSGVPIDRKGGPRAVKDLILSVKKILKSNQSVIIFPQGTRVPIDGKVKDYPYQPGITAIYSMAKATIVPVALNSGIFWSRNYMLKKGTITIEFLAAIKPGLDKKDFLSILEKSIEDKSEELSKNMQ